MRRQSSERTAIEKRLASDPKCGPLFDWYKESFEQQKRGNDCLYQYQKVFIDGDLAGRQLDAFRIFMERNSADYFNGAKASPGL